MDDTGKVAVIRFSEALEASVTGQINERVTAPRYVELAVSEALEGSVKLAVLMAAAEMFEARTDTSESQRYKVSLTVSRLINQYRRQVV